MRRALLGVPRPTMKEELCTSSNGVPRPGVAPPTDCGDPVAERIDPMRWLADQLADIPMPLDVENVRDLDNMQLLERRIKVRNDLYDRGEMFAPVTDEGRRLHSLRSAYLLDYYRRHPLRAD